jgi:FkbM family methyltransferase
MSDPFDPFKHISDQRRYGPNYYSHSGADLIVMNLFELLDIKQTATYLDIGAHHPTVISNTALLYENGLRGTNVEANPNLIQAFMRERSEDLNLNLGIAEQSGEMDFYFIDKWSGRNTFSKEAAEGFISDHPDFRISEVQKIPTLTLNDLINKYLREKFPDFLSIDVEGLDYKVLKGTDFSHSHSHPRIICAETVDYQGKDNYEPFSYMLERKGFTTYCRLAADTIFIWHKDASQLSIPFYDLLLG